MVLREHPRALSDKQGLGKVSDMQLVAILSYIRIQDIIDILFLTVVAYQLKKQPIKDRFPYLASPGGFEPPASWTATK